MTCTCGNYVSYESTLVEDVAYALMYPLDECVNCHGTSPPWYDKVDAGEGVVVLFSKSALGRPTTLPAGQGKTFYVDLLLGNGVTDRWFVVKDGSELQPIDRPPNSVLEVSKSWWKGNESLLNSTTLNKSQRYLFHKRGYMFL